MALNLDTLNTWRLRDPSKCTCLLGELSNLSVNIAAEQETHFTCTVDFQVLKDDYVIFSAYGSRSSIEVSFLIGRSINADVNFVLADDRGQMVVADVAVKIFKFLVAEVYAPNIAEERIYFFWRLAPLLDNPKWIILVGNLNAILDPKIDRVRKVWKQPNWLDDLSQFGRQISSWSPKEGYVDVAR